MVLFACISAICLYGLDEFLGNEKEKLVVLALMPFQKPVTSISKQKNDYENLTYHQR